MKNNLVIRIFDLFLSLILIFLLMPCLLLALIVSALLVGWPPVYSSKRIGWKGHKYRHYKFRSMKPGPELGRVFYEQQRINRAGWFLRNLHLDELPELFLILTGEMSFVGPRPLNPINLQGLNTRIRETVLPGWSGPAQVWLLKYGKLDRFAQIRLDNLYVKKRSLLYNIRILGATLHYGLKRKELDLAPQSTLNRRIFKAAYVDKMEHC